MPACGSASTDYDARNNEERVFKQHFCIQIILLDVQHPPEEQVYIALAQIVIEQRGCVAHHHLKC